MSQKKEEDMKWTKANFGPEETEERIEQERNKIKQSKIYMKYELEKQINVNRDKNTLGKSKAERG